MPCLRVCAVAFTSTPTSKDRSLGTPERKKPFEDITSGYSNSGFAVVAPKTTTSKLQ
jgi:hypothetical protein